MALRGWFSRRKKVDVGEPIGLGDADGDFEPGEGGVSIFREELSQFRWVVQQEALAEARKGIDPERWAGGRIAFEHERAIAHDHEGLRDRLANYVGQRIRDDAKDLHELAGAVATTRNALHDVDRQVIRVMRDWNEKHDEITGDALELNRFYRLRSGPSQLFKYLIVAVFIVSEYFISTQVFDRVFPGLEQGFVYVLVLGVTLALIVLPHYAALGLKEGHTHYHLYRKRDYEKRDERVPVDVELAAHREERDDLGFRRAATLLGVALALMIIPLTWVRANLEAEFSWSTFFFLLLLQFSLSGYFFLREWLDYGDLSHAFHKVTQDRDKVQARRQAALEDYSVAIEDFNAKAEDVVFTVQQAPRWDNYIVQTYNGTIRYGRTIMALENPECEEFIYWARVPYLGPKSGVTQSSYPLDPASEENRMLEEDGPFGRNWWMDVANEALRGLKPLGEGAGTRGDSSPLWLVTKAPHDLLREYLHRYHGFSGDYERPPSLQPTGTDAGSPSDHPPPP